MLLSVVDGREIEWIPLEESVRGAVRAARGLDRRLRGRLRGGQSYGTRAQNGVPGEVTAAELVLKAVSIHLARRVLHERVKEALHPQSAVWSHPGAAPLQTGRRSQRGTEPGVGDQRLPEVGALPDALHSSSTPRVRRPGSGTGGRNPLPHTDLPSLDLPTRPHPKRSTHPYIPSRPAVAHRPRTAPAAGSGWLRAP